VPRDRAACALGNRRGGAGAAAFAAVLAGKIAARAAVVPVTGRNIDPPVHAEIVARHPLEPAVERTMRAA
jgi:threonine dehydratase